MTDTAADSLEVKTGHVFHQHSNVFYRSAHGVENT